MTAARPTTDVLILGGGVIGLACALYLLRAGRSVRILEQGTAGCGSSHGNCGTITPSHAPPVAAPGQVALALKWMLQPDAPFRVAPRWDPEAFGWLLRFARRCNPRDYAATLRVKAGLLKASRALLAELVRDEALACEFAESGGLYAFRSEAALAAAATVGPLLREHGIDMRELDGAATRKLEPALNDSIVGGHHYPGDARLRPDRYVAELARVVRALGGQLEERTRVAGLKVDNGGVAEVATDRGTFAGREVVFALGAWSAALARPLGLSLPIMPGKGYSLTYSPPQRWPRIPVVLRERSVCVTGWESGFRLGSTMEFAGYDTSLNRRRLDALKRAAREYLREPEGPQLLEEWYGWRPMTYDDLPLIGRAPGLDNLILATGHGMLGVSLSPVTGVLVRELVERRSPSLDFAPLGLARFTR